MGDETVRRRGAAAMGGGWVLQSTFLQLSPTNIGTATVRLLCPLTFLLDARCGVAELVSVESRGGAAVAPFLHGGALVEQSGVGRL